MKGLAGRARRELARRVAAYRRGRRLPELAGRDVVLVDHGPATGVTAETALRASRRRRPRHFIVAVPVCARDTVDPLRGFADDVFWVMAPADFHAIAQWYDDFAQTTDRQVIDPLGARRADAGTRR